MDNATRPLLALSVMPAGAWDEQKEAGQIVIDHDRRFRRRFLLHTEQGQHVLLDLPQATRLRQDDGLLLQDGGIIRICARAEDLIEISAPDPILLMRIVWHLGNRHLPVQFVNAAIRIRADHVIADMVTTLGGTPRPIQAPFDPEGGAYAGGHHHHHEDDEEPHQHHHD